ncbi:hypothetical protein GGR58DRAFT_525588 [Xylaria digitata]|nr:hypothetical protein GGR58DRAFT_525588 [Xylaria digitata]
MQSLRQLADIPDDRFRSRYGKQAGNWTTYLHARAYASGRLPDFKQLGSTELELVSKLAGLEGQVSANSDVAASLTLVSISRDRDENILTTKTVFMSVFGRFGIDPRFLQLVKTNRYGLHYDWEGPRVSYYIGTALYILMWSFDRETRKTRAILLSRDFISTNELGSLRRLLQLEMDKLHSPFLLAWVSLVHLSNWMDSSTYYLLTTIRQLEELTGYGPYGKKKANDEIPIDGLSQASKEIGYVQVNLANQLRHVSIGTTLASHISTRVAKLTDYAVEPYATKCQDEIEEFNSTIPSLQRSLNDSSAYVYYLQERVRSQNRVVYALMTHEDARTNISLAKASKELAEAAKMDSSSMKSITIMSDFWCYWAFTVPSTLLIFSIWFGLHKSGFPQLSLTRPGKENAKCEARDRLSPSPITPANGYRESPPPLPAKPSTKYNTWPISASPKANLDDPEMQGYSTHQLNHSSYSFPYSSITDKSPRRPHLQPVPQH